MFIAEQDWNEEEVDDIFYNETSSYYDDEDDEIEDEYIEFADKIYDFLQGIINKNDGLIESFTSEGTLRTHYRKHCMAGSNTKRSRRNNIYYDFNNINEYSNREDMVSNKAISVRSNSSNMYINDLYRIEDILSAFRRLFKGGACIVFGLACQFYNNNGPVRICINSFATEATDNYLNNTVDFLIQSPNDKTITMYPMDANYLESKLNNIVHSISGLENYSFNFNH